MIHMNHPDNGENHKRDEIGVIIIRATPFVHHDGMRGMEKPDKQKTIDPEKD